MNLTREFWEKAYKENAPKMMGICRRYISDKEIAEDLVHDAFLTAINKSASYAGKGALGAWLAKITVNTTLMYLRHRNASRVNEALMWNENDFQHMDETNDQDARSVIEQAGFTDLELLEAIDKLPENYRIVFNLYVIDRFTHVQIGKELNISIGTSKSQLARARKKIQHFLFQKATAKLHEEKKKRRVASLFIFSLNSSYIDRLCRKKLSDFSLQPVLEQPEYFSTIDWFKVRLPIARHSLFRAKAGLLTVASSFTILAIVLLIYTMSPSSHSVVPVSDNTIHDNSGVKVDNVHTIQPVSKQGIKLMTHISSGDSGIVKPVMIKKRIIQRKSIIIKDTIKITDTSLAE
jgi:RNA polymerase sigma factor (sigma-70 family)